MLSRHPNHRENPLLSSLNAGAGGLPDGFGMPGGPPGGAMPPGMMMPGANGAPFDMSKIKEMLEDPSIKDMAKQIAEDPAFKSMAENMQANMAAGGALPGAGAAGPMGMPPGVDPKQAMEAMQNVMANPAFMQMAEKLGTQMMQDPQMASMMQQMQDPATTEKMKAKMEALKEDPEMAEIMKEIETGGPSAMMKYWNDPKVLQKISGAMGDIMPGMPLGDMGAAAAFLCSDDASMITGAALEIDGGRCI